jgi:hypothetical protein
MAHGQVIDGQLTIPGAEGFKKPDEPQALAAVTPLAIIQQAVLEGKTDLSVLQGLWAMQKEYEEREARKAFHVAMRKFKENAPEILKNTHVKFTTQKGVTEYDHASLDEVCDKIIPALAEVGITHRWTTPAPVVAGYLRIGCVLTHEMGYSDAPAELEGEADQSGGKNALQARNSTVSYLQRYTLLTASGMAAKNQDDDGQAAGKPPATTKSKMNEKEYKERCEFFPKCSVLTELQDHWHASYGEAKKIGDRDAMEEFNRLKDERKKVLLKDAVKP